MNLRTERPKSAFFILALFALSLLAIAAVNSACGKHAEEGQTETAEEGRAAVIVEGLNTLEGTVKLVHGPFLYIPEIVGFDVVLPAGIDASGLAGRSVRLEGEFHRETPSILTAVRIDVLEEENKYSNFYTKSEGETPLSFFNQHDREGYPALKLTTASASEAWEGKGRGRVFGRLEKRTVTEADVQNETNVISVSDEKGNLVGRILVDGISEFAAYGMKKLRLFDSFWFYLEIKESVEAKTRTKTLDLFRADVVFAGLY